MMRFYLRRMLGFLRKERVLTCAEVAPMLSQFIDQELGPETMGKIREHLKICPACRRFMESLENTSRVLRADPAALIPEEAARDMLDKLRKEYYGQVHKELNGET